ncbi:S-adenosyl-L-methionine-dependent methyltransferase [Lasiosphaeria hispida]|uniref:S-adenosyl-L-methionine-dependent methyltransferase n=1 Tax=Lasiosphaeria hispida TaxID=260671 RepID=A0AAJ0MGH4_9PEZI|nr:S-adenosyl-L-methionine-dependent methyltransferase [Lasiosphaeria hispida]
MGDTEPKSEKPAAASNTEPGGTSAAVAPTSSPASPVRATPAPATILPPEHWEQVALRADDDDADSTLGDDAATSTASISSTILQYRTIRGRTFHSEIGNAQYWGANDDRHNDALDVLHHLFTLSLNDELYLAPISSPQNALDIGTGTGIWAIDFADKFPECAVTGTDVSPIQPTWIPPNLKFSEIDDCTQEWTFGADKFDFVHIRYLLGCIPDWTHLFKQAFATLKPGGYLESYEGSPNVYTDDDTLPPTSAIAQWGPLFINGGKAIGRSFTIVDDGVQRKAMEEAGFVDIEEKRIKVPSGGWSKDPKEKELGIWAQHAVESDIEGFILFLTTTLGWTKEQTGVYIAHMRKELRSLKHHVYYYQKVVWGKKPGI